MTPQLPIWKHEAYIRRLDEEGHPVYYEHHYPSVRDDDLFVETSNFIRNGIHVHYYELR